VKEIQVCSNKGPGPLQRGDNHKNVKKNCGHLLIFFSRTTGPILTRLGINHPWGRGFKFLEMKGIAFLEGEVKAKSKNTLNIFKIFFYRTIKPKLIKFGTYYPWTMGIQVCSIKGPGPLQRGDNRKKGVGSFKNLILMNSEARKAEFYMKAF
jgi:hypothetical protein